jgi:hypothetical protein
VTTAISSTLRPSSTAAADADSARAELDRFAEALQPSVMGRRLAAALSTRPAPCHVLDAKYEPGTRGIVVYEHGGRLLRGDLLSAPDNPADEITGPATIVAPGVRIYSFPDDPELPALPQVMDVARLGPVLAAALRGQAAALNSPGTVRCRTSLLRYRPGKRATVGVSFVGERGRFVAKAYHDPQKAAAVADEAPALAASIRAGGTLRFAPTVAYLPELGLVVQRAVGGTPLDGLIGTTRGSAPAARDALRSAARALAELHEYAHVTVRQRSVERELLRFGARAARIARVDPELGAATTHLADRLLRLHADLPVAETGVVHGDCKPSQFLVTGQQVHLMDLDHLGISDQATDVGTFLASLRQLTVRASITGRTADTSGVVTELSELFLETYLQTRGDDRARTRIRWQEGVALERKALRAFARAPFSPLPGALVREANRCLDRLREAG